MLFLLQSQGKAPWGRGCPLPLIKGTPFVYLLLANGTLLHIPSLELCVLFNCCKCSVFETEPELFLDLIFYSHACFRPFGLFCRPKWQIFLPFHLLQLVKSLPFHIPEPYKRYPFRSTPSRASISHYRKYPPLFGLPTRTIFKNEVGYDAHHAKNEKPHVLPQQLWRRGWLGVCKSADPLWFIHHIRPSTFALNPKSGQKYFNYAQSPNSGPKKLMNPHSAAIAGSGNPLKSRFESEIWAKIFSNFADTLLKTESQIAGSLACSQGPKKKKFDTLLHTSPFLCFVIWKHVSQEQRSSEEN